MQRRILVIEASLPDASVALFIGDALVAHTRVHSHDPVTGRRSEGLMPAVVSCLASANIGLKDLTAVVCSAGPGGFTSLRSASAIAKGLCTALHIPLYAVPTMELLIASARLSAGSYVAALDAGRGEFYASSVHITEQQTVQVDVTTIVSSERLRELAQKMHATIVGPGQTIDVMPSAADALPVLEPALTYGPVNLDTWEPAYGRLAEAQVKWESTHGRALTS
jgi:tRNA threonylcarbamoyladenosine biosynthesis protein TsaB